MLPNSSAIPKSNLTHSTHSVEEWQREADSEQKSSEMWWNPVISANEWVTEAPEPSTSRFQNRSELRHHDICYFVDHVGEFVMYWLQGIGHDDWKLETFLKKQPEIYPNGRPASSRLNSSEGRVRSRWDCFDEEQVWGEEHNNTWGEEPGEESGWKSDDREFPTFVEEVARQSSVSVDRLHSFYQLPTERKLQQLAQLIKDIAENKKS
ncbi:hypothetical protein C8J56DRAFT_918581 [Mycena floridula]|nr:hypothetical protein C8J56DRAFT_918581 [Mycena floridula]